MEPGSTFLTISHLRHIIVLPAVSDGEKTATKIAIKIDAGSRPGILFSGTNNVVSLRLSALPHKKVVIKKATIPKNMPVERFDLRLFFCSSGLHLTHINWPFGSLKVSDRL